MPGPDVSSPRRQPARSSALLPVVVIATGLALWWSWEGPDMASQTDPSLDTLFSSLRTAPNTPEAEIIAGEIWALWHHTPNPVAAQHMSEGATAMDAGDAAAALRSYDAAIAAAPNFAEGWNRRATLYYMIGEFQASIDDIEKTLALEPRHFGALSGLALIREAQHKWFEALEALDRISKIHPKMPQLQERLDQLSRHLGQAV